MLNRAVKRAAHLVPAATTGEFYGAPALRHTDADTTASFRSISDFSHPVFQERDRRRRYELRLQQGHRCYGHYENGLVVSYFWLTLGGEAPFSRGLSIIVPPRWAYVWDCRTDASSRGRGLYKRGLLAARSLVADNVERICIYHETDNEASRRGIIAAGFARLFSFQVVRVARLFWVRKDGGWPLLRARSVDLLSER